MEGFTYEKAGVSIEKENKVVKSIIDVIGKRKSVEYKGIKMAMSTDGVGSKMMVANELKKWDTVGIDCIAMNVNDLLCMGAKPLAFVDYLAMEKMDEKIAHEIAIGLKKGAAQAGVEIIGGETATLPEMINGVDLAGTSLGIIEKNIPHDIEKGDVIIGLRSSGIHSNGLTLARKVFLSNGYGFHDEIEGMIIGEELLKPTKIYVKEILDLWNKFDIKGIAHITGSGLLKMMRMISSHHLFVINELMKPHLIFRIIQKLGKISDYEMYRTFNMGMGMAIVVSRNDAEDVLQTISKKIDAKIVGFIEEGKGIYVKPLGIKYSL